MVSLVLKDEGIALLGHIVIRTLLQDFVKLFFVLKCLAQSGVSEKLCTVKLVFNFCTLIQGL